MKRSVPAWVVIVSMLAVVGSAVAAVMVTRQVDVGVSVEGVYDFQVYEDKECTTILAAIDFGSVNRGATASTVEYAIDNQGEDPIYIKWGIAENVAGITFSMDWFNSQGSNQGDWPEDTYIGPIAVDEGGAYPYDICFVLTISIGTDVEAGLYSFTLTFTGSDDGTG